MSMDFSSLRDKLKSHNLDSPAAFWEEAFSRNIGLLSRTEQKKLAGARVAIPGMGGVGGIHLLTLARIGVGKFHIADMDIFEPANINRQAGARTETLGRPKVEVLKEDALNINPFLDIKAFPEGLSDGNLDAFLEGVDVVVDGLDFFALDIRQSLFQRAREKGLTVVTAGPIGFGASYIVFSPTGMTFEEYFGDLHKMPHTQKVIAFGLGLSPSLVQRKYTDLSKISITYKVGPSLSLACQLCSGVASAETLRVLLGRPGGKVAPFSHHFDPLLGKFVVSRLRWGNRGPFQRLKIFVAERMRRQRWREHPKMPSLTPLRKAPVPDHVLEWILRAGQRAPSGDNVQPWRFERAGDDVALRLDREADQSFFNIDQIASIISVGAVLENMKIAAAAYGLDMKFLEGEKGPSSEVLARVRFVPGDVPFDPLVSVLWERCTNRRFYQPDPLSELEMKSLSASMEDFPKTNIHFVTDRDLLAKLGKIVYWADRLRVERRDLHEHLQSLIAKDFNSAKNHGSGFVMGNLQAGFLGEWFLRTTRPWKIMKAANRLGLGRLVSWHSYQGLVRSGAAALVTVKGSDPGDFLTGGRALERFWLTAASLNISLQPMTAVTLFLLRWRKGQRSDFSRAHQQLIERLEDVYKSVFPGLNAAEESQVMLVRLGHAAPPPSATFRKILNLTDVTMPRVD